MTGSDWTQYILRFDRIYLDMDLYIFDLYKPYLWDNLRLIRTLVYIVYTDLLGIREDMYKCHFGKEHLNHRDSGYKDH